MSRAGAQKSLSGLILCHPKFCVKDGPTDLPTYGHLLLELLSKRLKDFARVENRLRHETIESRSYGLITSGSTPRR